MRIILLALIAGHAEFSVVSTKAIAIHESNSLQHQIHPLVADLTENPKITLTLDESIDVVDSCIRAGYERTQRTKGRDTIFVIGNTGMQLISTGLCWC